MFLKQCKYDTQPHWAYKTKALYFKLRWFKNHSWYDAWMCYIEVTEGKFQQWRWLSQRTCTCRLTCYQTIQLYLWMCFTALGSWNASSRYSVAVTVVVTAHLLLLCCRPLCFSAVDLYLSASLLLCYHHDTCLQTIQLAGQWWRFISCCPNLWEPLQVVPPKMDELPVILWSAFWGAQ